MNRQSTDGIGLAPPAKTESGKGESMNRIAHSGIGLTLLLVVAGLPATGQNQASPASQSASDGTSLGTYARQIRKDSGSAVKPKVFDNDNLPKDDKLSVVGVAPAASNSSTEAKQEDSSAAAPTTAEAKTGPDGKPADDKGAAGKPADQAAKEAAWKQWGDKIATQKNQIDLLTRELDVAQREYQMRAAAMYADVGNRLRNSADWDKQDQQYKQQIADKQKALDDAKQNLDDMQEEARKAGVPSSVSEP
jgi:hypothetical protein